MIRLATGLLGALLVQPLAQACEAHRPEVIRKGQHFPAVSQELANTELLFNGAKIAHHTLIQGGDENSGYDGWEEVAEALATDTETCRAEWETGYRLLSKADGGLKAALAAHETACGAHARSAAILSELWINRNP
jgi:hypothetical protein